MKKVTWVMLAVMVLPFVAGNEAVAQLNDGGYIIGQQREASRSDTAAERANRKAIMRNTAPVLFPVDNEGTNVAVYPAAVPNFCLGVSEAAAADNNKTNSVGLLMYCSDTVVKNASKAEGISDEKAEIAQNAGKEYYSVWMTYDAGKGFTQLAELCVDGVCAVGKHFSTYYQAGYQAMAESYMSYNPAEGYAQLGQMCVDGVCWFGKGFSKYYQAGYQAMAESYMSYSPAEGYAQLWDLAKKAWKKLFGRKEKAKSNATVSVLDNPRVVYPSELAYK